MALVGCAAVALPLALAGCGEADANAATQPASGGGRAGGGGAPRDPVPVRLASVIRVGIPDTVDAVGTLYGQDESAVSAKVGGRVVRIAADLGDRLPDGGVLAQIDPTDFQLAIDSKRLALREALAKLGLQDLPGEGFDPASVATVQRAAVQAQNSKARLDRAKQLFDQQPPLISPQDYADTETAYAVAQRDFDVAVLDAQTAVATARSKASELSAAEQMLRDATVRAPGAAVGEAATTAPATESASPPRWAVASRTVSPGELVQPGTVMYRLVIDDPVKLRASVPERFASKVKVGQVAMATVEGSESKHEGRVTRVSPVVDAQSRTFSIEVTLPNPDRALRPGGYARVSVTVGQRPNVPLVPASALYSFAGADRVFGLVDGKAKAYPVRRVIERREKENAVLLDANLGDLQQVIASNVSRLADGVPVKLESGDAPSTTTRTTR